MKINSETRFPHPVLSPETGDYLSGEFSLQASVIEAVDRAEVALEYTVSLTEPTLLEMVRNDQADVGIFVTCRETYFNRLIPLGLAGGRVAFEPGALLGRVNVRPMVWGRKKISDYALTNCHNEFGGGTLEFAAGSVLALDESFNIQVGREKLAQMESIFTIAKAEDLPAGTLSVHLETDKIRVLVAPDIYDTVNSLRGLSHGKPIILNSVYLPAVMQVLDSIRDDAAQHDGKRWYRIVDSKCGYLGISTENPDLWLDAQKLLRSPFLEINSNKEILGT